jgi:hypothetical protein
MEDQKGTGMEWLKPSMGCELATTCCFHDDVIDEYAAWQIHFRLLFTIVTDAGIDLQRCTMPVRGGNPREDGDSKL